MYKVAIKNNTTNETKIVSMDLPWDDGSEFWWTLGNASCDCNRGLFFGDSVIEDNDEGALCGDTKYTVPYVELLDGTRIPIDNLTDV